MSSENCKECFLIDIQKCCLEIVKTIDLICRKYDIRYSLCGGSVIGAYLFQGFIPWDDDVDLMMTRKDYDRLLEVFPIEASKRYRLLNYNFLNDVKVPTLFTRIEDMNTEVVEEIAGSVRKGHVFVDITVMDNVTSKFEHKKAQIYGSYVYTKLYNQNGMVPGTRWKRLLFRLIMRKEDYAHTLLVYKKFEKFCKKNQNLDTLYCAELMSAAYSGYVYDRNIFDDYKEIPFEDTSLMIVSKYMDYLYMRYGKREFSKEVPENQRFNSHIIAFHYIDEEMTNGN